MRCHRARELYEDYNSGALPLAAMARVEEHLAGCPPCREYFEQNDLLARSLRESCEVAHPGPDYFENLNARVLAALEEPVPRARAAAEKATVVAPPSLWRRPLWWSGLSAAAALLALALLPDQTGHDQMTAQVSTTVQNVARTLAPEVTVAQLPRIAPEPAPIRHTLDLAKNPVWELLEPQTASVAGGSMDKGVGGTQRNSPQVEKMIAAAKAPAGDSDEAVQGEGRTDVAMSRPEAAANSMRRIPADVYETLRQIERDLPAGEAVLTQHLRALDLQLKTRNGDQTALRALPTIRVPLLYLQGLDDLSAGRLMDASTAFKGILLIDELTPLATRARLQLADLFFSEWADFKTADQHYRALMGSVADKALTANEREHVTRQLDRLEKYRAAGWEPLHLVHLIRTAEWQQAATALRRLTELPGTEALLPEAGKSLTDRLAGGTRPGADGMREIYNLLAKQADSAQNGSVRAWLCLTMGDLAREQYQDAQQASDYYRRAIAADDASGAAAAARIKLNDLNERLLLEPVR